MFLSDIKLEDNIKDDFHNAEVKAGNSDSVAANNISCSANKWTTRTKITSSKFFNVSSSDRIGASAGEHKASND